jgi:hypothetical protein
MSVPQFQILVLSVNSQVTLPKCNVLQIHFILLLICLIILQVVFEGSKIRVLELSLSSTRLDLYHFMYFNFVVSYHK